MNLYVEESGQENEKAIIFLHGGGIAGWMWERTAKGIQRLHCLVPDLSEHGNSREVKPFTIEGAAEMIINLIRGQVHDCKAHLVGLSLGGQIIVEILSMAPEVVDHAFISGTLFRGISC